MLRVLLVFAAEFKLVSKKERDLRLSDQVLYFASTTSTKVLLPVPVWMDDRKWD